MHISMRRTKEPTQETMEAGKERGKTVQDGPPTRPSGATRPGRPARTRRSRHRNWAITNPRTNGTRERARETSARRATYATQPRPGRPARTMRSRHGTWAIGHSSWAQAQAQGARGPIGPTPQGANCMENACKLNVKVCKCMQRHADAMQCVHKLRTNAYKRVQMHK